MVDITVRHIGLTVAFHALIYTLKGLMFGSRFRILLYSSII